MIRLSPRPNRAGISLHVLAFLAIGSTVVAADGRSVTWRTDLGSAQAESKARDLPLWIQFTGPWCANCRRMERGAFVAPGVVAASRDLFVPVKLRSDEYEQLALSLGLSVLPSTVVVRPNGQVIEKWEGLGDPDEFLAFLEETLARDGRYNGHGKKPEIALASFCPVSLVDRRKLVPGLPTLTASREGLQFRFADETARAAFLARPEKYMPANRGECPVAHVDTGTFEPGNPRWGVLYRGHLFVCADAAGRDQFLKNPERYANIDLAARASLVRSGSSQPGQFVAQVPGRPAPSTATATKRSLIPAPSALMEAFLAPVMRLRR